MDLSLPEITGEARGFIRKPDPDGFEPLALRLFAFQFERNRPYRRYCRRLGKTPDTVGRWREIPAVPTAAFKELPLTCLAESESPGAVFLTSGTTRGSEKRGRHILPDLSLYEEAVLAGFKAHLLPDGARLRMMILAGPPALWENSSLSHMMEIVRSTFGRPGSGYYIKKERTLETEALIRDLRSAEEAGEPVILAGITLAFHQLIERARSEGLRFSLAPGSRIMDTGGFKGRRIETSQEELYGLYRDVFGIPTDFIVNEYGMTEMGSQFYDNPLANRFSGRTSPRFKTAPPWVRTTVLDPETLEEVPPGTVGMLQHLDLANAGSVAALLTEDLGYSVRDGFVLAGRYPGAEPRGCSLRMEEMTGRP